MQVRYKENAKTLNNFWHFLWSTLSDPSLGNQNSPSIHFPPKSTSFHKRILFSQTYISYSKFCEQPVFNTSYYILAHHSTGQ